MSDLAGQIKAEADRLGFALCGITSADPPPHHRQYTQWLAEGRAGEMLYLHRQEPKRGDLQQVLLGAKSVVCVALNYAPETGQPEVVSGEGSAGTVARYARFDDYHDTLWARLEALLVFIQTQSSETVSGKVYCDTGPITERDLAMRAGLGWIGKHTNLISRRLGNWFFLGEILLDIALPADTPETTHCGTCTRCLPACPTGAITAPYELDARRCISYLTIELKGSIPEELRPLIGTRIYGCDDCLAVCPWNKFAVKSDDPSVQPRSDLTAPDLLELLSLDEAAFRARFLHSPIKRTKRRGLLRNVCVALGNLADPRALPALTLAAETDPEPLIREHAQWALNRIRATIERPHRMETSMLQSHPIKTYRVTWDELMSRRSEIAPGSLLEVSVYEPESIPQADQENRALISLLQSWRQEDVTDDPAELERRDLDTEALLSSMQSSRLSLRESEA